MRRFLALSLVALTCVVGDAQPLRTDADPVQAVLDEFPPHEATAEYAEAAGRRVKRAMRALGDAPMDPRTVELLAEARRLDDAVSVLERIIAARPDRSAAAVRGLLRNSLEIFRDARRDYVAVLRPISARAKQHLATLPREEAATLARELLLLDNALSRTDWRRGLPEFIAKYAGTAAALSAEVTLILQPRPSYEQLAQLDAFARAHPGTAAAAEAIFHKGFQLQSNIAITGVEPRGSDPTPRFLQVVEVLKDLESGKYPKSEWVDRAPELLMSFFYVREAKIAPENVDRMLAAYEEFVIGHFATERVVDPMNGLGYTLTGRVAPLFAMKGVDPLAGVEQVLAKLESDPRHFAAARYLRGLAYTRNLADGGGIADAAQMRRAKETLTDLSRRGKDFYHRLALATAGSLHYYDREYAQARDLFKRYVAEYPASPFAWMAAVRGAQSDASLGNRDAAVSAFLAAAKAHANNGFAAVIIRTLAGETLEDLGRFDQALQQYRAALAAWDDDYGPAYRFNREGEPITRQSLQAQIQKLAASTSLTGGDLLERGRRALATRDYEKAIQDLTALAKQHPDSAASREGRSLLTRARWERSIDTGAFAELDALMMEPFDFGVFAATVTKAVLAFTNKQDADAEALMRKALTGLREHQRTLVTPPATAIEQDVIAIQNELFLPTGGGAFNKVACGWNAFELPARPPEFLFAPRATPVTLANRRVIEVSRTVPFPSRDNVLFFDASELTAFVRMLDVLGGTERRVPGGIMETPNQPIGRARDIEQFWKRFFPIMPGHWGGWELLSFPRITAIEFTDDARTRALARVTVGYSGATAVLEKVDGKWLARQFVNCWIM